MTNETDRMSPVEVQKYLAGTDYPASKNELIEHAQENDADQRVFDMLNELPDKEYNSPADVSKELGNEE
jgi:hypothetical protein